MSSPKNDKRPHKRSPRNIPEYLAQSVYKCRPKRTHCICCGDPITKKSSRGALYCSTGDCQRQAGIERHKLNNQPDLWINCARCKKEFPVWFKLQSHWRKKEDIHHGYCGPKCARKGDPVHNARKGAIVSQRAAMARRQAKPKLVITKRRKHCFRDEPFGLKQCANYSRCDFITCKGYTDPADVEYNNTLSSTSSGKGATPYDKMIP